MATYTLLNVDYDSMKNIATVAASFQAATGADSGPQQWQITDGSGGASNDPTFVASCCQASADAWEASLPPAV